MAFQGSLRELPLPDIIQLVSVSGKTGVFTLRSNGVTGEIFLRDGQIVHATTGELVGEEAVYELAIWNEGDFLFTPGQEPEADSVRKSNTNLLMEAARRIDEWRILSMKIPSTRLVPVFTQRAATSSVSLAPQEWRLICQVDERRSIEEVSVALETSPFEACKLLYGLITSGLVDLRTNFAASYEEPLGKMSTEQIHQFAAQSRNLAAKILSSDEADSTIVTAFRLFEAESESGRLVDAVLGLVRNLEKAISTAKGSQAAQSFLDRVGAALGQA